jgi:hypothetical protein
VNETTNSMNKNFLAVLLALTAATALAQTKKPDTVIVELAKSSRVLFVVKDRADMPTLRAYDYQALFKDILNKIEADSSTTKTSAENSSDNTERLEDWSSFRRSDTDNNDDDDDDSYSSTERKGYNTGKRYRGRRSSQLFNFDIGMNNYLSDGKFPDENNAAYAVRPWGSWYVGMNSIQKVRVAGRFFVEMGLGVSWYNFKFQNDALLLTKGATGLEYPELAPELDPIKSKLTATYLNVSMIPVLDFGSRPHRSRFWGSSDAFRIGFGPYAGYRIDSYSKQVYKENGNKERDRERSNFYLNNVRYGARLQVGYRGTDLFVNYDLNELFITNRGPKLNAFSFGVIF